MEMNAN